MNNPKSISFRYFVYRMMRLRLEKLVLSDVDMRLEGKLTASYGFCFSTIDFSIREFPELYSRKPKFVLGAYWYDPRERDLRMKIIRETLDETRAKMNRRQVIASYLYAFIHPLELLYVFD